MKKKVLITGGLGFIGTNLVKQIDLDRYDISILDNYSNTSETPVDENVKIYEGDIRSREDLKMALKGKEIVIHLAAHTRVIDSIEDPFLNFDINVKGALNILEEMRLEGVGTIVNASTGGAILGEVEPPVHENIAANPASPYGASKLAVEGYCSAYSESYGIQALSLRFSNIYGKYSKNKGSVVAAFIKGIVQDRNVTIYGDGSQIRDYLYVNDLVTGIIGAIESGKSGVFQLGSGIPTDLSALLVRIKEVVPYEFSVKYEDFRAGELRRTFCDITKAREAFNFQPSVSLNEGINNTWEWFRGEEIQRSK